MRPRLRTAAGGAGAYAESCEAAWWRSMEELVPVLEKEGINLHIEPHPEDWVETLHPAVDMIRMIDSKNVQVPLLRAAHLLLRRRHRRDGPRGRADPRPRPRRGHLQPQGLVRPALHREPARLQGPGAPAPQHRPGRGGLGRPSSRPSLDIDFDGIVTACVFAWEDKAVESSRFMRKEIQRYLDKQGKKKKGKR